MFCITTPRVLTIDTFWVVTYSLGIKFTSIFQTGVVNFKLEKCLKINKEKDNEKLFSQLLESP